MSCSCKNQQRHTTPPAEACHKCIAHAVHTMHMHAMHMHTGALSTASAFGLRQFLFCSTHTEVVQCTSGMSRCMWWHCKQHQAANSTLKKFAVQGYTRTEVSVRQLLYLILSAWAFALNYISFRHSLNDTSWLPLQCSHSHERDHSLCFFGDEIRPLGCSLLATSRGVSTWQPGKV